MKLPGLLALSIASLMLGACNLAPDYQPPAFTPPEKFKETGPWQDAKPADTAVSSVWWHDFGDPLLDQLEDKLTQNNPDLAATVARYDQARAMAVQAEAGMFPSLSAGGDILRDRQSNGKPLRGAGPSQYNVRDLDAQASYELDLWGSIRNTAAAGRDNAQVSAAELAGMRLSLQSELASDYLTLRGLDADAKLLADTVAAYEKALDLTQTLLKGSIGSGMDVSRAETQFDTARAQLSHIAGRRATMENAIAVLVGDVASNFAIPPATPKLNDPAVPTVVPATILQRRPDIAIAERQVAAANADIGVARAAFYPAITLGALGGFQSTKFNLLSLPYSFWSIGPTLSLPLLNGGMLDAEESGAYAVFRERSQNYRSTVINAFREVEDNLALIRWLNIEIKDEDAAVKSATKTLDIAMKLYHEGASSYLDVVTAQTALLQTQQASIDLRTRHYEAEIGLIRALGGGWKVTDLPTDEQTTDLAPATLK